MKPENLPVIYLCCGFYFVTSCAVVGKLHRTNRSIWEVQEMTAESGRKCILVLYAHLQVQMRDFESLLQCVCGLSKNALSKATKQQQLFKGNEKQGILEGSFSSRSLFLFSLFLFPKGKRMWPNTVFSPMVIILLQLVSPMCHPQNLINYIPSEPQTILMCNG